MSSVEGTGNSFIDAINGINNSARKVSLNSSGNTTVVNEGNTDIFKKAEESMGKDQFLNLLVAQLKYQDPLEPAKDTAFVAQLAQFSQLEFTQNSTQAISSLASNMQAFMDMQNLQAQSITNASATPLLGKTVRVMEASFDYTGGGKEFNINLSTKNANVVIKDKEGNIVAELDAGAESSKGGDTTVKWDGINKETGQPFLSGNYSVEVVDVSTGATKVGYAYQEGPVTGVNFSSTGSALTVNGVQYGLGYLVSVDDDASAEDSATKQMYMSSVQSNGANLEFVPEKYRTEDVCRLAVMNDGNALKFVPNEMKTKEICVAAVKENYEALEFVPDELKEDVKTAAKIV